MKVTARPLIFLFLWLLLLTFVSTQIEAQDKAWGTVSRYDIVTTAKRDGRFQTFVTAVEKAGMEGLMREQNSYTIFLPTDAAFSQLPEGTIQKFFAPENRDKLTSLLKYHMVINKRIMCDCLNDVYQLKTLNGKDLAVWYVPGRTRVGHSTIIARITEPDITTKNGIIHVIDAVLVPR